MYNLAQMNVQVREPTAVSPLRVLLDIVFRLLRFTTELSELCLNFTLIVCEILVFNDTKPNAMNLVISSD